MRYGEHFYLKATDDYEASVISFQQPLVACSELSPFFFQLWLTSKMACLTLTAKPSGRNPVFLAPQPSHLSEWKVLPFKPKDRMELEYTPVPVNNIPKIKCEMKIVVAITFDTACIKANEKVCIANVKTGHCLCLEQKHTKS